MMKEAITIFIKGRFDPRRWLHASQARRMAVTAPLSGRVRRARCRCASRTPVGNEGGSAVLSTCMRRARCRCAIRRTSINCGRTAHAIRRNQTQSDAIRRNQTQSDVPRSIAAGRRTWLSSAGTLRPASRGCRAPVGKGGRRGEHTCKRPASRDGRAPRSCALPATIKRQSRGNQ